MKDMRTRDNAEDDGILSEKRLMNSKDDPRGILKEDTCSSTKETEKDQYALPMPLRKL